MVFNRLYITLAFILIVISCKNKEMKEISFISFSVRAPIGTKDLKLNGIDSRSYAVIVRQDTIFFDYGLYSRKDFDDDLVAILPLAQKRMIDSLNIENDKIAFSENADIDRALGLYLKEFYLPVNIDEREAILKIPKEVGNGYIEIVFTEEIESGNYLNAYCKTKDIVTQNEVIDILKSIKFEK